MILTERVKLLQNVILQRVFMRCSCMLQNRRNAKPTVFAKRGMQSFALQRARNASALPLQNYVLQQARVRFVTPDFITR